MIGAARAALPAAALAAALAAAPPARTDEVSRTLAAMGTTVALRVAAPDRATAIAASEAAARALDAAAARLSTWQPGGALAAFNAAAVGVPFSLDPATAFELTEAVACSARTGGFFDPTVGALVDAWGLRSGGRLPSRRELRRALAATGTDGLRIVGTTAARLRPGLRIEEGGFGKGAALDAALAAAAAAGATAAVIDAGGQLALLGPVPVAIAHPTRRQEAAAVLKIDGGHMATSGNGERSFVVEGRRYGHLLDPQSGRPAPIWGSVTVLADRGLAADCLATALYVMGPTDGLRWAAQADVAAFFLVDAPDGLRARASPAWLRLVGLPPVPVAAEGAAGGGPR